jgi:hypothetical protein
VITICSSTMPPYQNGELMLGSEARGIMSRRRVRPVVTTRATETPTCHSGKAGRFVATARAGVAPRGKTQNWVGDSLKKPHAGRGKKGSDLGRRIATLSAFGVSRRLITSFRSGVAVGADDERAVRGSQEAASHVMEWERDLHEGRCGAADRGDCVAKKTSTPRGGGDRATRAGSAAREVKEYGRRNGAQKNCSDSAALHEPTSRSRPSRRSYIQPCTDTLCPRLHASRRTVV